jgi:hypothetical protein
MPENPFIDDPEFFECELITVQQSAAADARSELTGCERCTDDAQIPFDWILRDVMHREGMYEFILQVPVTCPKCLGRVHEKTRVARGGIEVASPALG